MSLRDWMNNNPAVVTIGAVVLLVLCLGVIVMQLKPNRQSAATEQYYFDLNTSKVFVADVGLVPPIEAPSGPREDGRPAGVRAYIYGCGGCPGDMDGWTLDEIRDKGAFIAYFEMMSPQAKAQMERARQMMEQNPDQMPPEMMMDPMMMEGGNLISAPDVDGWFTYESSGAQQIFSQMLDKCPGDQKAEPCLRR